MTPRSLEQELLDPEALRGLVLDGIVDLPACEFPRRHTGRAAPYWHEDGRPACSICHPQPRREATHGDLRDM
jgi:hypothetical protein